MVERHAAELDRVFRALASEPRREILRRVARRRCTVTELADQFDMSLAAVSKHVGVLDAANLLVQIQDGRRRWRRFNPEPLEVAREALDELRLFWTDQLERLERFLATDTPKARTRARKRSSLR